MFATPFLKAKIAYWSNKILQDEDGIRTALENRARLFNLSIVEEQHRPTFSQENGEEKRGQFLLTKMMKKT